MEKPNITPGSWYRSADDAISGEPRIINAFNKFILRLGGMDMGRDEDQANATAIAALPDLLEALEQARELVALCRPRFPKSVKNPDTFKLCLADAAINKALVKAGYTL